MGNQNNPIRFKVLENLDRNFHPPENFILKNMFNEQNQHLRMALSYPADKDVKGVVVIFQGLSEFIEKYAHVMTFFNDRHYAVAALDWRYQGGSYRHPGNYQLRHSDGFEADRADAEQFLLKELPIMLEEYGVQADLPKFLLGHSMGGAVALMTLAHSSTKDSFQAACLSAPLIRLHLKGVMRLVPALSGIMNRLKPEKSPLGDEWTEKLRPLDVEEDIYSKSPDDARLMQRYYYLKNSNVRVCGPSWSWLYHAARLHHTLEDPEFLGQITTPVHIFGADNDCLASPMAGAKLLANLSSTESSFTLINESFHEILHERPEIRNQSLEQMIATFDRPV